MEGEEGYYCLSCYSFWKKISKKETREENQFLPQTTIEKIYSESLERKKEVEVGSEMKE